jgi:integrase
LGKREAVIPLYDDLREVLARISKRSTMVLTNSRGRPWLPGSFSTLFIRAKQAADMADTDLHFHDLRGTAATRFYTAGLARHCRDYGLGGGERRRHHPPLRRPHGSDQGSYSAAQQEDISGLPRDKTFAKLSNSN